MTQSQKENTANAMRFINTAILSVLTFLLVYYFNDMQDTGKAVQDIKIRQAVMEQVQAQDGGSIRINTQTIEAVKERVRELEKDNGSSSRRTWRQPSRSPQEESGNN